MLSNVIDIVPATTTNWSVENVISYFREHFSVNITTKL